MGEKLHWEAFRYLCLLLFYPPANWEKPPLLCWRQNNVAWVAETCGILELPLPVRSLVTLLRLSAHVPTHHSGGCTTSPHATVGVSMAEMPSNVRGHPWGRKLARSFGVGGQCRSDVLSPLGTLRSQVSHASLHLLHTWAL